MQKKRLTNLTVFSLFIGYTGYYLCRSNLSVANSLLAKDGYTEVGSIAAAGVLAYAVGKLFNSVSDFWGGKRVFIFGMVVSAGLTVLFGLTSGMFVFTGIWVLNRLVQAMGWAGLVKVASQWIDYRNYGKVMGFLSVSYLAGDTLAKLLLGQFIKMGFDWRTLFFIAAFLLSLIAAFNIFFLKEKPSEVGLPAPEVNPANLFAEKTEKTGLLDILLPYLSNISFLLIILMSIGLTSIREVFSFWIPIYLEKSAGLSAGNAAQFSSFFSLFGIPSVLLAGWVSDTVFKGNRSILILICSLSATCILFLMTQNFSSPILPIFFTALMGFFLLGAYSFLAGAMSMDMGGNKGASTAVGLVDGLGYFGATIMIKVVGSVAKNAGWGQVFLILGIIAFCTALAALSYYFQKEYRKKAVA